MSYFSSSTCGVSLVAPAVSLVAFDSVVARALSLVAHAFASCVYLLAVGIICLCTHCLCRNIV